VFVREDHDRLPGGHATHAEAVAEFRVGREAIARFSVRDEFSQVVGNLEVSGARTHVLLLRLFLTASIRRP
jgi:hypothetical protein